MSDWIVQGKEYKHKRRATGVSLWLEDSGTGSDGTSFLLPLSLFAKTPQIIFPSLLQQAEKSGIIKGDEKFN